MVTADEVSAAFEDLGIDLDDPKVADLLVSLCDIYKLDADQMSTEVLAFMYRRKMDVSATPTLAILGDFEEEDLKRRAERMRKKAAQGIVDVSEMLVDEAEGGEAEEDDEDALMSAYGVSGTPVSKKRQLTPDTNVAKRRVGGAAKTIFSPTSYSENCTPGSKKYASRANAGSTVIRFGSDGPTADWKVSDKAVAASLSLFESEKALTKHYRFMFESLHVKAGCLDESLCRTGESLVAKYDLEEPESLAQPLPESFVCFGRVCCDSPDGRLNAQSLMMQGGQDVSEGKIVSMDVSRVDAYSLFPGQVVCARAINPSGEKLLAMKIFSDASPPLPVKRDRIRDEPLSIVVASGPFTTSDNLSYHPLTDLLKYVSSHRPHVAVLCGPFVDAKHEVIESCLLDESFDDVFGRVLGTIAETAKELPTTQIVLVASARDVHHFNVYPTPPFVNKPNIENFPENVRFVSDPCMLDVQGFIVGVTTTDILFHLGREEISHPRTGDRLRRLATNVIQQASFYPLLPPAEDVNIDYEKWEAHARMSVRPHLLVLPSDLLHFFKDIDGGLVMNPGRLAKHAGGGVFARLLVRPEKEQEEPIISRIRGEIVRV